MTNKELIEDLLTEFDELGMEPTIIVPNPIDRANAWKHELTYAIKHLKPEVAREIFEEIENRAFGFGSCFVEMTRTTFDEIKKKYTEGKT